MDIYLETLRTNLKNLMESRNYTINTFSEAIGITSATISRYLSGSRIPDITYLIKISKFFNVSIDWLVGINGDKFEVLPAEVQDVLYKYSIASPADKKVIKTILERYS